MGLTGRGVHLDVPLSNVVIAYRPEGFIADQIAPIVPVQKQSDSYYVFDAADAFRTENDKRAPGTEANVMATNLSSGTFFAKNFALKDRIPYEDLKNADAAGLFFTRQARGERVKDKLMLNMEYRVAMQCTSGSNVGSYSNTASAWTDYTNSNPITDIHGKIAVVEDTTGYRPNSIIFGNYAWRHFRQNANVIKAIFGDTTYGNSPRVATVNQAKALFETERVLIGGAYFNANQEGQANSLTRLWNDNVLIYYAPMTARIDKPSFMYSFRWNEIPGMSFQAEVFDLPKAKAEEVQVGYYQDEKITASTLGFLLRGVGSSQ